MTQAYKEAFIIKNFNHLAAINLFKATHEYRLFSYLFNECTTDATVNNMLEQYVLSDMEKDLKGQ